MHLPIGKASVAILALCKPACSLKATILADTNHDGIVNAKDEDKRTEAIFIANIGDTNQRCSKEITSETPDDVLDQCHDASDNEQRNPKYLAPIHTLPCRGANIGTITVVETTAAEKVRIFVKTGNSWMFVNENHTFTAQELENGLVLGIDARDVRRPQEWDGRATIRFTVTNNASEANDEVKFRVAPVLTHHHGQNIVRILTSDDGSSPQGQFISDLKFKNSEAGIRESVYQFQRDIWTQDFFEPAYTSFPGPNGPITLRVMIRSSQVRRVSGRQVFTDLQ